MSVQKSPVMMLMLVLFLVLVSATIYRIITALETHPGMVVDDAYETGERYGTTLKNRQELQQQGWNLELKLPEVITHGIKQTYTAISTKQKNRLNKADAIAYFYRPLEMKHDFSQLMTKNSNGTYEAVITLPLKGRWDLLIEVSKGDFLQQQSARMFAQ